MKPEVVLHTNYNIEVLENCSIDAKNLCVLSTNTHTTDNNYFIFTFVFLFFIGER